MLITHTCGSLLPAAFTRLLRKAICLPSGATVGSWSNAVPSDTGVSPEPSAFTCRICADWPPAPSSVARRKKIVWPSTLHTGSVSLARAPGVVICLGVPLLFAATAGDRDLGRVGRVPRRALRALAEVGVRGEQRPVTGTVRGHHPQRVPVPRLQVDDRAAVRGQCRVLRARRVLGD